MHISLIVIRCQDIDKSKKFYESLGLKFERERHGHGVEHFSTVCGDTVFELYPNNGQKPDDNTRLGFKLKDLDIRLENLDITSSYDFENQKVYVVTDPDGRKVELH